MPPRPSVLRRSGSPRQAKARKDAARKIRVGVIFGGRSVEHEVSLESARAVMAALDPRRYEVVPIGISQEGRWLSAGTPHALPPDPSIRGLIALRNGAGRQGRGSKTARRAAVASVPARSTAVSRLSAGTSAPGALDVVFPVVHGTGGEDGTLQGLLELADIPYVGAGVLGSALGMDKAVMKALFREAGLPIVDHRVVRRPDLARGIEGVARAIEEALGYPCFVKPANGGSSVGVSKAKDLPGLVEGLRLAARYDRTILVERGIDAREIECSVLGNDAPEASVVGEIVPVNEFYDYKAKYIDRGSRLIIPAPLEPGQSQRVRDLALRAFRALDLAGMARVDFFLERGTGRLFVNELNTIPGFTPISMYSKMWEASGLSFPALVDRLIALAFERHAEKKTLITHYEAANGTTSPHRSGKGRT